MRIGKYSLATQIGLQSIVAELPQYCGKFGSCFQSNICAILLIMEKRENAKNQSISQNDNHGTSPEIANKKEKCGLVMPIAGTNEYPSTHWVDVKAILVDVGEGLGYETMLVSDDGPSGLIHSRIVGNLYSNPIVICDVSSKNPNVMFELGMRLAFDMPTIIIKDEITNYTFDAGVVEHLVYPASLHYHQIGKFKDSLEKKILDTVNEARKDKKYSPFLKTFNRIYPKKIEEIEVSEAKYIMQTLGMMQQSLDEIKRSQRYYSDQKKAAAQQRIFEATQGFTGSIFDDHLDNLIIKNYRSGTEDRDELLRIVNEELSKMHITMSPRDIKSTVNAVLQEEINRKIALEGFGVTGKVKHPK